MKKVVFYLSLFIISWVFCIKFANADWDLWARLAVGKIFFITGTLLKHDPFAYTPVKDLWVDHEWGSSVIFYTLSHYFGDAGLMLLKIFNSFITLFLISRVVKLQNPKINAHINLFFYAVIYLLLFSGLGSTVRCQQFTFLLFTLYVYLLERVRRGDNKLLFIIPPIMLLWANLHGGFVSGLGLLCLYGIGELLNKKPYKKYFIVLIPSILVTLINPYGIDYWTYMFQAITMKRDLIVEWDPTNLFGPIRQWKGYKIVFLLSVITLLFTFIKKRPRYMELDKVKYLVIFIAAYISLSHIKHQPFFGIAAGCFLYHDFYSIFDSLHRYIVSKFGNIAEKILKNTAILKDIIVFSTVFIFGGLLIYSNPIKLYVTSNMYPVGSIEFVKQNNLTGNVATLFQWGSYAFWKLYPKCKVALDGRYEETYPESTAIKVGTFFSTYNKASVDFMKKHHTDIIIIKKSHEFLHTYNLIRKDKSWKLVYMDEISGVFIRADKANRKFIEPVFTEESIMRDKYKTSIDGRGEV